MTRDGWFGVLVVVGVPVLVGVGTALFGTRPDALLLAAEIAVVAVVGSIILGALPASR